MKRKLVVTLSLSLLLMLSVIGTAIADTENYHMFITSKSDCKFTLGIFYESEVYRGEETEYIVVFSVDSISESIDFINNIRLGVRLDDFRDTYEWQSNHSVSLMEGEYIEQHFIVKIPSKALLVNADLKLRAQWDEVVAKGSHNFTIERDTHWDSVSAQIIKSRTPQDKMWQGITIFGGIGIFFILGYVFVKKVLKW